VLNELARSYLDAAQPPSKPSTLQAKADLLRLHILPALGERPVDAIDDATVAALAERKLADGARPKTVNNILSCLRQVLAFGAERDLVAELPRFPWHAKQKAVPRPGLLEDDAKRLVEAAEPGWQAMIALALAGLRLGELLGLRWADVDLAKRRVAIRRSLVRGIAGLPERGRPRRIALDEQAVAALRAHRHDRGRQVFCDAYCAPLTPELGIIVTPMRPTPWTRPPKRGGGLDKRGIWATM
jgi:integrase